MKLDRWDVMTLTGAGLVGGGVWGMSGPAQACIVWGVMMLALPTLHALSTAWQQRQQRREHEE